MPILKRKLTRWILAIAGILIVAGIGVNIFAAWYLNKIFTKATQNSDIPYDISVEKFRVNVWSGCIKAYDVNIAAKDNGKIRYHAAVKARAANITFTGIRWTSLFLDKKIRVGTFSIQSPVFNIALADTDSVADKTAERQVFTLYNLIRDKYESIAIRTFTVEDGKFTIAERDTDAFLFYFPRVNFRLSGISVDSTLESSHRILEAANYELNLQKTRGHFENGLYEVLVSSLICSSQKEIIDIDSLKLRPAVDKKDFSRKLGYQTDCINFSVAKLTASSKKLMVLLLDHDLFLDTIQLHSGSLHAYRDKNIPRKAGNTPMHHTLLKSLDYQLDIRKIKVDSFRITYEELAPEATESGAMSFYKLNGSITNISNVDMNDTMRLKGSAYLLNKALVTAEALFPLKEDKFFTSIDMGPYDMKILNPMIKNLAPVAITDGEAHSMKMWCGADNFRGTGQMTFIYSHLKVQAIDKGDKPQNPIIKGLMSFIANDVFLVDDNPKDSVLRVGKIDYERNPQRNVINYNWNLIFSGFKSSIGLKEEKMKKVLK
jgi:hypothetical protein